MNITKVVFMPEEKAPLICKDVEYFAETTNWDEAIKKASIQFKLENELWHYYKDAAAKTVRVL